ncbi:hypothetical protein ANN_01347 [Periplaneta americana]|uniref:Uncharacterized protein n=1 Tax=Periplaneta americana TaxID=6978 RepID=A0ABQ8TXD0_PERAM|nr:hypothetical protein ANN_01347 [Periplaneta americana]
MAGLCEGGNEPPGTLKASIKIQDFPIPSFAQTPGRGRKVMSGMVMSNFRLLKNNVTPNVNVPQLYHGPLKVQRYVCI